MQAEGGNDKETSGTSAEDETPFAWTWTTVLQSIALFGLAGLAEIVGGWMVWVALRGNDKGKRPWWYALVGSLLLCLYGFIPLLQPTAW